MPAPSWPSGYGLAASLWFASCGTSGHSVPSRSGHRSDGAGRAPPAWAIYHVYFDRSRLRTSSLSCASSHPGLARSKTPRQVLIELAHEYRRVVSTTSARRRARGRPGGRGQELLLPLRRDYSALPRVIQKTTVRTLGAWWNGARPRLLLPQGGSTLTQQLVRAYFLRERTSQQDGDALFHDGLPSACSPRPWVCRPRTSSSGSWRKCACALARGGDAPELWHKGAGQA